MAENEAGSMKGPVVADCSVQAVLYVSLPGYGATDCYNNRRAVRQAGESVLEDPM